MLTEKIHLEPDEIILAQVRKHWFILFTRIVGLGFASLFPYIIYILLTTLSIPPSLTESAYAFSTPMLSGLYAIWLLGIWIALFRVWTDYYLDVWTVTTKRVVAIDQIGFFRRKTSSFRLERLQDITVEIHGLLATFLNFGSIRAQTAGADSIEFIAKGLPSPREFKALILRAADETTFSTPRPTTTHGEV